MLKIKNLRKVYTKGVNTEALKGINLDVEEGEFVGIMGPSGSGKTTLLNIISTIDTPSSGEILIKGENPNKISKRELSLFRRNELGMVFQYFNLLDSLSVKENIALPMILNKEKIKIIEDKVLSISETLGISSLLNKHPYEISGGEAQRTAIGRAIINNPSLLLADEPTGNLDSKSSNDVMQLIELLNKEKQTTTILVTHDPKAASFCNRVIFIKDGLLFNEIHKGDSQQQFFNDILQMLSFFNNKL